MPKELQNIQNAIIRFSSNAWMDNDLTAEWVEQVWGPAQDNKRMLIWDSFKCHISDCTKTVLGNTNTIMAVVPGGCTKLVQPADVSWNAPFKAAYRKLYDEWQASGNMEQTRSGNLRAPSKKLRVEWVLKAWNSVKPKTIWHSFEACGITTSDPTVIHCTKETGTANAIYPQLLKWHQKFDRVDAEEDNSFHADGSADASVSDPNESQECDTDPEVIEDDEAVENDTDEDAIEDKED